MASGYMMPRVRGAAACSWDQGAEMLKQSNWVPAALPAAHIGSAGGACGIDEDICHIPDGDPRDPPNAQPRRAHLTQIHFDNFETAPGAI